MDELSGVRGVPGSARRYHQDGIDSGVRDDRCVLLEHVERPGQCIRGQAAGGVHPLAKPDDFHPAHQVGQHAVALVDIGDEQAKRVGAAIYRRDAKGARCRSAGWPGAHGRAAHWRVAHGPVAAGCAA